MGRANGDWSDEVVAIVQSPELSDVSFHERAKSRCKEADLFGLVVLLIWCSHILGFFTQISSSSSEDSSLPLP